MRKTPSRHGRPHLAVPLLALAVVAGALVMISGVPDISNVVAYQPRSLAAQAADAAVQAAPIVHTAQTASAVQSNCEKEKQAAAKRGSSDEAATSTADNANLSDTCVAAVIISPNLNPTDPNSYRCIGKSARVTISGTGLISNANVPDPNVPAGDCLVSACQPSSIGDAQCSPAKQITGLNASLISSGSPSDGALPQVGITGSQSATIPTVGGVSGSDVLQGSLTSPSGDAAGASVPAQTPVPTPSQDLPPASPSPPAADPNAVPLNAATQHDVSGFSDNSAVSTLSGNIPTLSVTGPQGASTFASDQASAQGQYGYNSLGKPLTKDEYDFLNPPAPSTLGGQVSNNAVGVLRLFGTWASPPVNPQQPFTSTPVATLGIRA